jgi:hypothetical protein
VDSERVDEKLDTPERVDEDIRKESWVSCEIFR